MPYAVEMFFDVPSDSKVCSLWEDFGSIGASHMKDCGARPHITLAVCDSADVSSLSALLDTFARTLHPFPVTLSAVGDRKSTRLNSSHVSESRMPSSA